MMKSHSKVTRSVLFHYASAIFMFQTNSICINPHKKQKLRFYLFFRSLDDMFILSLLLEFELSWNMG
jgi:hypothetical protein